MLVRILETEVMDTVEEARDYDAMDHNSVNARFVTDFLAVHGSSRGGLYLDVGTGTARIPILLAKTDPSARILALDLAEQMLVLANANIAAPGLSDRIQTSLQDAKAIGFPDGHFEAVFSNTIIHHIPEPKSALAEMARLVAPGGTLFIRDLERPETEEALNNLVKLHAGQEAEHARSMFQASLHAALTLDEVQQLCQALKLPPHCVNRTSDRHWTLTWRKPAT